MSFFISFRIIPKAATSINFSRAEIIIFKAGIRIPELESQVPVSLRYLLHIAKKDYFLALAMQIIAEGIALV